MKEIPILFSTSMVQAIMVGRKRKTRRIINPQPIIDQHSGFTFDGKHKKQYSVHNWQDQFLDDFSRWMPDDRLWVRESWSPKYVKGCLNEFKFTYPEICPWIYKADDPAAKTGYAAHAWKPSIHMPKEASRIWLRVGNIKIEQLQDISSEDAIAEGFSCLSKDGGLTYKYGIPDNDGLPGVDNIGWPWQDWEVNPIKAFQTLWKKINGEESWNENPWLWVIDFEVLSMTGKP